MKNFSEGLSDRELEIFDAIHKSGPATKNDLMDRLHLKLTTLNRSMEALEKSGLIADCGISVSTGGRKPVIYDVNPDGAYAVGLDISRTYARIAVMDLKLRILASCRMPVEDGVTPPECVHRIAGELNRMIGELSLPKESILGIGVGTVGPMNRRDGILLRPQGFPDPAWDGQIPLKQMLRKETGLPCEIDNGANAAALAEYYYGAGRGFGSVAYLHCGVGIRSAVIRDGAVIRTMNDRDDAFAHMTVDISGAPCRCGGRGCLEQYASLEAIRSRYQALTGEKTDYPELFDRAGEDKTAAEAFQHGAEILAVGIHNLVKLVNPELIILSGPLVSRFEPFFAFTVGTFRSMNGGSGPVFSKSGAFKENVIVTGGGLMILEKRLGRKNDE